LIDGVTHFRWNYIENSHMQYHTFEIKKIEIKVFQQMLYHVGDVFEPFMPRTISKQLKTMKE